MFVNPLHPLQLLADASRRVHSSLQVLTRSNAQIPDLPLLDGWA